MKTIRPEPGMLIAESCRFAAGEYLFDGKDGITIQGDNIVIDGGGAVLISGALAPEIPPGDYYYTSGSMGCSDEEAELRTRKLVLPARGMYTFEYTYWGKIKEVPELAYSRDGKVWSRIDQAKVETLVTGWTLLTQSLGSLEPGPCILKLTIPQGGCFQEACFFDAFRILKDGELFWSGDARNNWDKWYNTGFSIFKRDIWKPYKGVAIRARGSKSIEIRNCTVKGFDLALSVVDCVDCTVAGNDFSDNFSDADYGWEEGLEALGGIYLEKVSNSLISGNRVHNVWNGLVLRKSSANRVEKNDVSHCSNVCLKMSQSSHNNISGNIFSWGLRIYPGEVHARDSVSFLMESGSNENIIENNDFSHGGDGIFIRVLNHWCSMRNVFKGNDCSYANNNAIEAWSPGNTYIGNKANHSSYGFWLGGSDDTVLLDNEAIGNGIELKNAPEPFGNAGISVVHGSSSGFLMARNRIQGNCGPGLSLAYKLDAPAWHWLIADNDISNNTASSTGRHGPGILAEYADTVHALGNMLQSNDGGDIAIGASVSSIFIDSTPLDEIQQLEISSSLPLIAGAETVFKIEQKNGDMVEGYIEYQWSVAGKASFITRVPELTLRTSDSGRMRIGVVARRPGRVAAGSRVFMVVPKADQVVAGIEWRLLTDGENAVVSSTLTGGVSGMVFPTAVIGNGRVNSLLCEYQASLSTVGMKGFSFFYRYECELPVHTGFWNRRIGLRIELSGGQSVEYIPEYNWDDKPSEDRYTWVKFFAPLESLFPVRIPDLMRIETIAVVFGPQHPADIIFSLDGLYTEATLSRLDGDV